MTLPAHPPVFPVPGRLGPETVMPFTLGLSGHASVHERETRREVVRRLARLKGCVFADESPPAAWVGRSYLVPSDTLVGTAAAAALGVFGPDNLFGGVVPQAFVATKAITHPLWASDAAAPPAWSAAFPERVAEAVLPGYSVFSREDARRAAAALFRRGPLRVKPVGETGGRGQTVVADMAALEGCLAGLSEVLLREEGVVLEHNLSDVTTLSVGQVWVAGLRASYHGEQRLTPNNHGALVYGGSDLCVVRGDFDALLAVAPTDAVRTAVAQALVYDSAARACFPGFFASRINYDIAQGLDAAGRWCSGVLEQSWRAGGATGAEVAALEALQADPALQRVRACCVEKFGAGEPVPPGAVVYFQGVDPQAGPLTKYALVQASPP